jgi:hypothetical protein
MSSCFDEEIGMPLGMENVVARGNSGPPTLLMSSCFHEEIGMALGMENVVARRKQWTTYTLDVELQCYR